MKMYLIFVVAIIAAVSSAVADNGYCSLNCKSYGGNEIKHIACGHNNLFDQRNCPKNAKMVQITEPLKKLLVDAHNEKRNFIAGGGDRNHRPACRMATMEWDDELAKIAALNVKQCHMEHDKCRKTKAFEFSGQNLAVAWQSPPSQLDSAVQLKSAVEGWFSEVKYSRQSFIDSYPERYSGPAIGHFTVMMADRNIRLGCAASTYTTDGSTHFLTACNYATTNMLGHPIYAKCNSPGESCKSKSQRYPNLCSEKEQYAVNKWF